MKHRLAPLAAGVAASSVAGPPLTTAPTNEATIKRIAGASDRRQPCRPSASKSPRLYRGDGTAKGTVPVSPRVCPLWDLASRAGRLWAIDSSPGQFEPDELRVSDGTADGTKRVYGGTGEWFIYGWDGRSQVGLDGWLWFAASPIGAVGNMTEATDSEVWSSNGTTAGTAEAADINADGSAFPRDLVKLGHAVLFSADDGIHGRELWSLRTPRDDGPWRRRTRRRPPGPTRPTTEQASSIDLLDGRAPAPLAARRTRPGWLRILHRAAD